jgi:hypothetical protein
VLWVGGGVTEGRRSHIPYDVPPTGGAGAGLPTLSLHGNGRECGVGVTVVMGGACRAGWTATASRTHRGLAGAGEQVVNENEVDKSKSERNDVKTTNRYTPCLAPVVVLGGRLPCKTLWSPIRHPPTQGTVTRLLTRGFQGHRSVGTSLNGELRLPINHPCPARVHR